MKRALATLLALAMLLTLALAGCTGNSPSSAAPPSQVDASKADTPTSTGSQEKLRVSCVFPQSLGDAGPIDAMNNALKQAASEFNLETATFEALQPSMYEEALRTFARDGADMIIASMPGMAEAVKTVAAEFPEIKFCIIFPLQEIDLPNVVTVDFSVWEAYYLAGIMAGHMSESGKIGHIVGAEQSALIADYNSIKMGAKSVNANADVMLSNANTFDDPAKGKEAAMNLFAQGCDVLITDAAKTALGAIEAAQEKGYYIMADSAPHYELAPGAVLLDTNCAYGPSLYTQVKRFAEGKFESGLYYSTLAEGGVEILRSPVIRDKLPDAKKAKYDAAIADIDKAIEEIKSGKLVIERNIQK